jgi:hypothetical protein
MPPALIEARVCDSEDDEQCQEDDIAALSADGQSKQTDRDARACSRTPRAPTVGSLSVTIGAADVYKLAHRS